MEIILHFIKSSGWLIIVTAFFGIALIAIFWKGIKDARDMPVFPAFSADEMIKQKELDRKCPDENDPSNLNFDKLLKRTILRNDTMNVDYEGFDEVSFRNGLQNKK